MDTRVCLTLQNPWAWLVIRPDITNPRERAGLHARGIIKDVENRSRRTSYRGTLYIHAGKAFDETGYEAVKANFKGRIILPQPADFPRGGIIGRVNLTGCVLNSSSEWAMMGLHHWLFSDAEPLPFEPMRGMQGMFRAGDTTI